VIKKLNDNNPFSKYWVKLPEIFEKSDSDIRATIFLAVPPKPHYLPQSELKGILSLSKATIVYHLDILEKKGLIRRRRVGKYSYLQRKVEEYKDD
jgi:DNA-binding transcriptional ArsR family regulator